MQSAKGPVLVGTEYILYWAISAAKRWIPSKPFYWPSALELLLAFMLQYIVVTGLTSARRKSTGAELIRVNN